MSSGLEKQEHPSGAKAQRFSLCFLAWLKLCPCYKALEFVEVAGEQKHPSGAEAQTLILQVCGMTEVMPFQNGE